MAWLELIDAEAHDAETDGVAFNATDAVLA